MKVKPRYNFIVVHDYGNFFVYNNNTSDFAFLQKNVYEGIQLLIEKTSRGVKGLIEENIGVQVAR
jgi:hypothetical protein